MEKIKYIFTDKDGTISVLNYMPERLCFDKYGDWSIRIGYFKKIQIFYDIASEIYLPDEYDIFFETYGTAPAEPGSFKEIF